MTPMPQMRMKVGRRFYPVASFQQASEMFVQAREASGMGASEIPTPLIYEGEKPVAYVSYNGRVWEGSPLRQGRGKMLYDACPESRFR